MIPHHRGATDRAEVELRFGRDPTLRTVAEGIVAGRGPEISDLRAWLARRRRPAHLH